MSHWYLGTIGFSYKDWVGPFYPSGLSQRGYLPYYCKEFNSVELDTTFHAIPLITTVQSWLVSSPGEFKFCLKTPRVITHELGLKGAQGLMTEFMDSIDILKEKLGPILIQLPPRFTQENIQLVNEFLESLPNRYQYAIEFRHSSWYNEKTLRMLTTYHVGWVSIDFPNVPKQIYLTADFLYIRWIGINNLYHHHSFERVDKTSQLKWWLQTIDPYLDRIPVIYGFFNNDYAGFAAGTCKRFKLLAGLINEDRENPYQERLF